MQIEGTKQTVIMNFSVLDYSNLLPECLKLHRFSKGMPSDPVQNFLFFFISSSSLCLLTCEHVLWTSPAMKLTLNTQTHMLMCMQMHKYTLTCLLSLSLFLSLFLSLSLSLSFCLSFSLSLFLSLSLSFSLSLFSSFSLSLSLSNPLSPLMQLRTSVTGHTLKGTRGSLGEGEKKKKGLLWNNKRKTLQTRRLKHIVVNFKFPFLIILEKGCVLRLV